MKKYLMTGVAALALCAGFTACSNDEDFSFNENEYVEAQKALIEAKYQQAFVNAFGQPAKNHTWGFGNYTTRTVFANGNEWAANDRADLGWKVPPVLTDAQKEIVRIYFQSVKDPDYIDPQWSDYFMQQVYKGHTEGKIGSNSPEAYKSVDGNNIIGSDHMDHLAAIDTEKGILDHINNFNHGDAGVYGNVLDYVKATATTPEITYPVNDATHRHADKINLMTGSTTKSFGYYNSDGSLRHTEYTGLVSWQTIKTWADANGHAGEADCLDDGWNRSFMGFDFEQMVGNDVYAKNNDGSIRYLTYGDLPSKDYVWDGTTASAKPDNSTLVLYNNKPIPMLASNRNMYCGEKNTSLDDQNKFFVRKSVVRGYQYDNNTGKNEPYYQEEECIDIDKVLKEYAKGYNPVADAAGSWWVKVGGCADHYYSDWIVCLTKAEKYTGTEPVVKKVRILCEDMNAGAEKGDFDFNDAVIDLTLDGPDVATANVTKIEILHTGAQFDIFVETSEGFVEVHDALRLNKGQFGSGNRSFYPKNATTKAIDVIIKTHRDFTYTKENGEKEVVDETIELNARKGEAPAKICVGIDCEAPSEREAISSKYPDFEKWVKGELKTFWRDPNEAND